MKRVTRDHRLTPEEAATYKVVREQVADELPELAARHHERMAALDELLLQLKAAREARGLSLADLTDLTGMARSATKREMIQTALAQPRRRLARSMRDVARRSRKAVRGTVTRRS